MEKSSQTNRIQISCPDSKSLEKILLEANKNPLLMDAFERHRRKCIKCQKRVKRMRKYYAILEQELEKPVSPKVIAFAKLISNKK